MAYDEESVVVSVCCITYNHAKYISQCLDGIVSQKTNFKYELIINDDCSTDGTTEIVKRYADEYPELIRPIFHEENQWSKGIKRILTTFVYPQAKGKYIALCEGDDYWIDPLKLQKQVEYMDTHPECSLCCTDAVILTAQKTLNWTRYHKNRIIPIKDLIIGGGLWVQTASFIFKKGLLINWPKYCNECHVGDYPLILWAALNGYVYYLNDKTAIYRYQSNGSWTARQGKMGTSKKVPGWISELRMLDGLNEYSSYRFSNYFKKRQTRYMFAIFSNYRYNPHQFTLDFSNHLDDLPFIFRYYVKVSLNHNYSCIYLRIIKRICTLFYA